MVAIDREMVATAVNLAVEHPTPTRSDRTRAPELQHGWRVIRVAPGDNVGMSPHPTPSVAVVLGAGGVVGVAWNAGILAALAEFTGFDARRADLVVGTSAGASVAAHLRQGFSPADLFNQMLDLPLSPEGQRIEGASHPPRVTLPDPPTISLTGWRPQAPQLAVTALARLRDRRPGIALSGLAPRGSVPHRLVGDPIRARQRQPWPDEPTWLCAVRLDDGAFTVFGRDPHPGVDLATAVEASVAIPGYFSPVEVDGRRYVDGGARSVTNADVVAGLGFDLVVVTAPMAAVPAAVRPPSRHVVRALHARRLAGEVQAVRRAGTPVVVFQPTATDLAELGSSLRSESAAPAARTAHRSALVRLRQADAVEAVERLRAAAGRADDGRAGDGAVASAS